ncbi:family 16 glycosylhydrolase [uncultured Flavobacterium sp.]|uniref:family 16 glycosylhydrolase n=1 Tax=uncultured Flavobacterium sp. TaxID=165435 RepID=UPI0030CA31E9
MKIKIKFILILLVYNTICFSQVDVVYADLVWFDEFDSDGAVNNSNWHHQTQIPAGGNWYNGEQQHYTSQLTNSFVTDGSLNIVAIKEAYASQGVIKQYTSARLNSKFAFKYGRIDIRAKIPVEQGTWPALWMLGKNINEDGGYFDSNFGTLGWPACGEIDIMEHGITQTQPFGYVQSAIHTPSSYGSTVNFGGTIASNLNNTYHVYSMNWSPFEISFLLDDVVFYTYDPAVKTASNWPFDEEQYLLLNIAMGGVAGSIPSSFTQSTMIIDYVRVYQNILVDTQAPTAFTASVGAVTSNSVKLLLNANDNAPNVVYNINYGVGSTSVTGTSGIQKSLIISGLNPITSYTFSCTASDLASNVAVNNPIVLNATTLGSVACSGTDTEAQQGSFSTGYSYNFETIGNDVKITFELLDTDKVGVVGILWNQSPFVETYMTNVSGNIFTHTITGQTIGQIINYAVKFAFAGGLSVTKYCSYIVGDNCTLGENYSSEFENFSFLNPASNYLNIASDFTIDKVEVYTLTGNLILQTTSNTKRVNITNIPKGVYLISIFSEGKKSIKKLIIN